MRQPSDARRDMVSIEAVEKAMREQWGFPAIQNMDEWIAGVLARLTAPETPSKQDDAAVLKEAIAAYHNHDEEPVDVDGIEAVIAFARKGMVPASELKSAKIDWGVLVA